MPKISVLVTGATGFIGSNLVRHLISNNLDVHVLIRVDSSLDVLNQSAEQFTSHVYDGTIVRLKKILAEVSPTHVFHLASLFLSEHDDSNLDDLVNSNIVFSTQLVEAMVAAGVTNLINTGTSWQHYEQDSYNPVNLYAATKQAFESILTYYIRVHGLKVITLLLFDTYGENDPRKKIFNILYQSALSSEPILMSPGEQLVNIVHVEDVVKAFYVSFKAISGQEIGHLRYGISSGQPIPLRDLVGIFEKTLSLELNVAWGERPYRKREVMIPWDQYEILPGWSPEVVLEEGIARSYPLS